MLPNKTFIIYYTWSNTAHNHAGMTYLVKQIKKEFAQYISLIKIPEKWQNFRPLIKKALHVLIIIYFKIFLRKNDLILFMEFLGNCSGDQAGLAIKLRRFGIHNKFTGLVHLSPSNLKELHEDENYIINSLQTLNNILVFGTSLERYFVEKGFKNKIRKTFHYVDTNYYRPADVKHRNSSLQVICMGSLKRNHSLLKEIIEKSTFAEFVICMGESDYSALFEHFNNVTLRPYLSEEELLMLMQRSDVSLSVLFDTVGSNVILTSMATGLVNVVSDVGSIRDYCNENDSFLCSNAEEFVKALLTLANDSCIIEKLSKNSINSAFNFDLKLFLKKFPELVE